MTLSRTLLAVVLGSAGCAVAGPAGAATDPVETIHRHFVDRDRALFGALAGEIRTVTTVVRGDGRCPGGRSFRATTATRITWSAGESSMADDHEICLRQARGGYRVHAVRRVRAATPESGYGTTVPPGDGSHRYDAGAAARYALAWSDTRETRGVPEPRYNPDYARHDDDSANFVSQALEAGGWNRRAGIWSPADRAWTEADGLYRFAVATRALAWGRSTPHSDDIWRLTPGDLLFADWTSDGAIDHAMIVVGLDTLLGFTEPTISQHSPHRHNLPLSIAIKMAALEFGNMSLYPVTPHASYRESAPTR